MMTLKKALSINSLIQLILANATALPPRVFSPQHLPSLVMTDGMLIGSKLNLPMGPPSHVCLILGWTAMMTPLPLLLLEIAMKVTSGEGI